MAAQGSQSRHRPCKKQERACAGCNKRAPRDTMIRWVLHPETRKPVMDYRGKLPGRGTYTCLDRSCIKAAIRSGFSRKFRGKADLTGLTPELVLNQVGQAAGQRALKLLGLHRRAGMLAIGFDQVTEVLRRKNCSLLLLATDLSEGTSDKLFRAADTPDCPEIIRFATMDQLGQALGHRPTGIVAALKRNREEEGLTMGLLKELKTVIKCNEAQGQTHNPMGGNKSGPQQVVL